MVIEKDNPAAGEDSESFWRSELANCRILLNQIDKALYQLMNTGITEYSINTGQNSQTVKRADIPGLMQRRDALLCQIQVLESRLQIGGSHVAQVVPGF
jgi:hypothetical protein